MSAPASVPSSTRSTESIVVKKPLREVWEEIRPMTFSWWKAVKSSSIEGSEQFDRVGTSTCTIEFTDGSKQTIRLLELSDYNEFVTYELLYSDPPQPYLAAIHTISCLKITADETTLVTWNSEFSSSGGQELQITEDSKWKKREALAELKAKIEGGK